MTSAPTRQPAGFDDPTDDELIRASLEEPSRFDVIYTRHARAIFAFACARVGPDVAEDITAETFAAAFRFRANYVAQAPTARPWLYGIAANTLRRHGALEARWLQRLQLDTAGTATGDAVDESDQRVDASRLTTRLAMALTHLTPGERDVLLLHVLADLTHEEIARTLGVRRGTVKSRLSRGRARLRAALPELADELDARTMGGEG